MLKRPRELNEIHGFNIDKEAKNRFQRKILKLCRILSPDENVLVNIFPSIHLIIFAYFMHAKNCTMIAFSLLLSLFVTTCYGFAAYSCSRRICRLNFLFLILR